MKGQLAQLKGHGQLVRKELVARLTTLTREADAAVDAARAMPWGGDG